MAFYTTSQFAFIMASLLFSILVEIQIIGVQSSLKDTFLGKKKIEEFATDDHANDIIRGRRGPPGSIPKELIPTIRKSAYYIISAAQYSCKTGFVLKGGLCSRQINTSATSLVCPSGWKYEKGENTSCIGYETTPVQFSCDDGFRMEKKSCIRRVVQPFILSCPPLFEIGKDTCQRRVTHKPTLRCSIGSILENGMCRRQIVETVSFGCPEGYIEHGGDSCLKEDFAPSYLGCEYNNYRMVGDSCHGTITKAPYSQCPAGFHREGTRCVRQREVAFLGCDSGKYKGKGCYKDYHSCPMGCSKKNGICVCTTIADMEQECDQGYVYDALLKQCKKEVTEASRLTCPPCFFSDKSCVQFDETPIRATCPIEFLNFGKICAKQVITEPLSMCPEGHAKDINCTKDSIRNPDPVCPTGFHYDSVNKNCYKLKEEYDFENSIPTELLPQYRQFVNYEKVKGIFGETRFDPQNRYNTTEPFGSSQIVETNNTTLSPPTRVSSETEPDSIENVLTLDEDNSTFDIPQIL
ncbi:hypothetical protein IE077_003132 [Cardiosporidium cionae]|uniref:Uncharacterized protein n=1 Tax=Cardiosporidium cionae TaxID=476202 RepID=A0ABQ7J945_9APIC|nr:hypothetical protein IE077_003132 [Cardiosporidium cionae]|eukprot:KAF8820474.1 hypothetical protein IE077_003132 [Cardiosporidium cionae]